MQGVLLSHKLLIQFDSRVRKLLPKISETEYGVFDQELDVLCLGMPRQKLIRSF